MIPENDELPLLARSARALGVRVEGSYKDVVLDAENRVAPGAGGLSVAPESMWNLPNHRRPIGMGRGSSGKPEDCVFFIDGDSVARAELNIRPDAARPTRHAFVEPAELMELSRYESNLASTRESWVMVWP